MNQKVNKKDVNEFEGSVLNYINNVYDQVDLINKHISRQDFISELQKKYTNEEIKGLRTKKFIEIADKFEDVAIEKAYGKKPNEEPDFFKQIRQKYSFGRCYNLY